jgi:transketolase
MSLGGTDTQLAATRIRRTILEQSKRVNVGHIGSCLSIADLLAVLYSRVIRGAGRDDVDRDRFILSKGHAALALYAALLEAGILDADDIGEFCGDGSPFGVHPEHAVRGVDFSTGSLGMGLSIGAGSALAAKLSDSSRRTYVLMSDAELNEGSVWEAVMFASHHRLANLVAIIDLNGQQALGYTADVLDLHPLSLRWRAFGWAVTEIDGHDHDEIESTVRTLDHRGEKPHVVIAKTTFGKGVPFMESQIRWHYSPIDDHDFARALAGLGETTGG